MNPAKAFRFLHLLSPFLYSTLGLTAATPEDSIKRGEPLFQQRCLICHGAEGRGVPNLFPPLAGSDWLKDQREKSIRVVCEGLSGRIRVNGVDYEGSMPAQALNDQEAADVFNYIGTSWGNNLPPFTADEIKAVRAKTRFPTFEVLAKASAFQPLPPAPAGYEVKEVVRLPEGEFGTRFAGDGKSTTVYFLTQAGSIWRLNADSGAMEKVVSPADYLDVKRGGIGAMGLCLGPDQRLWITTNQVIKQDNSYPLNEITIYRTAPIAPDGKVSPPERWLARRYPHGGGFNHGVSNIAFGPDGALYVSSGSRTDGGEKPPNHPDSPAGEVEFTACLWKLDPKSAGDPAIEVYARGLRNPYGFAWDPEGRLFAVTNGPDANAPEEMDFIEKGRHYGFPYQFADWPVEPGKPYPHTPAPPPGLTFTLPVKNLGPAGGGSSAKPMATFEPHSCPTGMIWCGPDFPAPIGNGFLVTRYGNLLGADRTGIPSDSGFDVLAMQLKQAEGEWTAQTVSVLAGLGRPIDVIRIGPGRALIMEYTRPTNFKDGLGWMSGRVIELRAAEAAKAN